jgi:thiamine transport system permease protein
VTAPVALAYSVLERRLATPVRADRVARHKPQSIWQWLAVGLTVLTLVVFCAAPVLVIVLRAMGAGADTWAVLIEADTLHALWNTVRFSSSALVLATVLGVFHALAAQRWALMRAVAFLPFVVSPVLVAFGLLLLYPAWTASAPLLVAAYALLAYPFIAKALASALDSIPAHYMHAAASLGASPWRAFWRVRWPLLQPALRRGMAFAAATAIGEFAVTLFLSRPEWATLTTLIYEHLGRPGHMHYASALVLSCALMVLAFAAFIVVEWPGRNDPLNPSPYA